jgi:hypothetical protein
MLAGAVSVIWLFRGPLKRILSGPSRLYGSSTMPGVKRATKATAQMTNMTAKTIHFSPVRPGKKGTGRAPIASAGIPMRAMNGDVTAS